MTSQQAKAFALKSIQRGNRRPVRKLWQLPWLDLDYAAVSDELKAAGITDESADYFICMAQELRCLFRHYDSASLVGLFAGSSSRAATLSHEFFGQLKKHIVGELKLFLVQMTDAARHIIVSELLSRGGGSSNYSCGEHPGRRKGAVVMLAPRQPNWKKRRHSMA